MAIVHLTRRAAYDIEQIDRYSVATWGRRVANEYMRAMQEGVDRLEQYPDLLRSDEAIALNLQLYRVRKHVFVCDRAADDILILGIFHASTDLAQRVAEREPMLADEIKLFQNRVKKKRKK